jgi:RNA recognition motif-containing protein
MSELATLYVGGLPYSTDSEELSELFTAYGPVSDARIVEGKGFGFVDIPAEQMQAAIDGTNGMMFRGRTLTVNQARPRSERPRSFGSGGGGGGRGGYGGGGGGRGGYGGDRRGDRRY